jgi:hypothetical protein
MRLVTFQGADGQHRAGALFNQDEAVLDLRIASQLVRGGDGAALTSVQALIEGGEAALAEAQSLLARTPSDAVVARSAVKLLAPVQPPRRCAIAPASSCTCASALPQHAVHARCRLRTPRQR